MTPNSSLSLLHVFSNCIVYSKFPYSCIFLRTCNAYAEIGLFVLIYLICSLCLVSIDLPVWPTYALSHILHCNLYIPLEFILFCGVLHNWLYIVLHIRKDMFKSVLLNKLVILCMSKL